MVKQLASHHDYSKYMFEGATTFSELVENMKTQLKEFEKLLSEGAVLTNTVDDGHILYTVPNHEIEIADELEHTCSADCGDEDENEIDCIACDSDEEYIDDMCQICYTTKQGN